MASVSGECSAMHFAAQMRRLAMLPVMGFGLGLALPAPVRADLTGGDRAAFVKNFAFGCGSSQGTQKLMSALGGTGSDQAAYCGCVANAYADRLSVDTMNQMREIERLSLDDWSRKICLDRHFPAKAPNMTGTSGRPHYPKDAGFAKSLYGATTGLRTIVSADSAGPNAKTQFMLLDAKTGFFCWSDRLGNALILSSTDAAPVISAPWCETGEGGYAEILKIGTEKVVVGYALQDGRSGWQVNEITIE
jgi:hypothetical protein